MKNYNHGGRSRWPRAFKAWLRKEQAKKDKAEIHDGDFADFRRRKRIRRKDRWVFRPFDDVNFFAAQLADDGLHARAFHPDTGADRVDVAAPSGENPSGTATFTNLGSGTLNGIVVSDVGFIVPQAGLVTIAPGATASVGFQVDRTLRPDADALSGTAAVTLSLVYATGSATARSFATNARRGILDTPGVGISIVTVVDTVKPTTSSSDVPPLGAGDVALLIPGVGYVRGGVGLFISDVTITNVFGVNPLSDVGMYFTPSMDAPAAPKSAPVAPVAPGQGGGKG